MVFANRKTRRLCGLIAAIGLFSAQSSNAQVLYGSMVGNVIDPSNSAVPGATVAATNLGSNQSRETTTNALGGFSIATLPSGTYVVRVSKPGFAALAKQEVSITTNNVTRVDFTLQVGAVAESMVVTASAAGLQTDRAEVRQQLGEKALAALPLPPGRNYASLFGRRRHKQL